MAAIESDADREAPASKRTPPARRHVPALDGLRGLAIALVLAFHGYETWGRAAESRGVRAFFLPGSVGWCGVDLFFVLSGFLITGILLETRGDERYFRSFFLKRSLRIFPLYFATLAVFFLLLPLTDWGRATLGPGFADVSGHQLWFWAYLQNWWIGLVRPGWPAFPFLHHLWSLGVEEQFYLVWPFLIAGLSRRALPWAFGGTIALAFAARAVLLFVAHDTVASYVLTLTRMDSLAIGGLLALAIRSEQAIAVLRRRAGGIVLACGLGLLALFVHGRGLRSEDPYVQLVGFDLLAVASAAIVFALVIETRAGPLATRIFSLSPLRALGRVSYGVYVFHLPVFVWTARAFAGRGAIPGPIGEWMVAIAITLVAAMISWSTFESPLLKLKSRFD